MGEPVTWTAIIEGDTSDLTYNFAWAKGVNEWDQWDSTTKGGNPMSTTNQGVFAPRETGQYRVWVDVADSTGKKLTSNTVIFTVNSRSDGDWELVGVNSPDYIYLGSEVRYSAVINGNTDGLVYNYAWAAGTSSWDECGSTRKDNNDVPTTEPSGTFTPTHTGTYRVWVDVFDGNRSVTTEMVTVEVRNKPTSGDWLLVGVDAPMIAYVGDTIEYSPIVEGNSEGLNYNYVWRYGTTWEDWDSNDKRGDGHTTETSGKLVCEKKGTYYVWLDAWDPDDNPDSKQIGSSLAVQVIDRPETTDWSLDGVDIVAKAYVGDEISYSAIITGNAEGLRYNYAWAQGMTEWNNWDSTLKSTGDYTTETNGTFTPTEPGTYRVWCDAYDADGNKQTSSEVFFTVVPKDA